ncbi:MAG: succinate dehydrogenase, hydrophobic membrane anchor protein [Pseudomonadota bacterium]|nr:succinate dehydrogenase, hydrophobic membrane anchor protein [Pseudomonadota bacterium]
MAHSSDMRTKLARVKGLGASHHAVGHWWWQRVTALALVPLSLWFLASLLTALMTPDVVKVAEWFASPLHALPVALLAVAGFWHAKLGLQVVIEDYVHAPVPKYTLLLINALGCFTLAAVCILAVLKLHMLEAAAGM